MLLNVTGTESGEIYMTAGDYDLKVRGVWARPASTVSGERELNYLCVCYLDVGYDVTDFLSEGEEDGRGTGGTA